MTREVGTFRPSISLLFILVMEVLSWMIHKALEGIIWRDSAFRACQLDVSVGEVSLVCADDTIAFYCTEVTQMNCLIHFLLCFKQFWALYLFG